MKVPELLHTVSELEVMLQEAKDTLIKLALLNYGGQCVSCGEVGVDGNILHYFGGNCHWHNSCHKGMSAHARAKIFRLIRRERRVLSKAGMAYMLPNPPEYVESALRKGRMSRRHRPVDVVGVLF